MTSGLELVEFLGGPLDGYQRTISPEMLAQLVEFDVSENTFRIMAHERPSTRTRLTSTVVYQLGLLDGPAKYHFLAAIPPRADKPRRRTIANIVWAALGRAIHRVAKVE